MDIHILSDLHLESPKGYDLFTISPRAPYLALLGDIGNVVPHKDEVLAFLTEQLRQFKAVLFVPGNHEAYYSTWEKTLTILRDFQEEVGRDSSLGEFVLLDRGVFHPPGTNTFILGCSLFSRVPNESQMAVEMVINDFYLIQDWTVAKHNDAHVRDLTWLNDQVAELDAHQNASTIIILTHWSPSRHVNVNDPRHIGSRITSGFSTDLMNEPCFTNAKVKVWAFGHTHYNCDVEIERGDGVGKLRLLANQRGYYFQQADGFDIEKSLSL
ncbi:Metallo-dependent phosphatase-like protein, partial [Stachybotrys elegans]